MLTHEKKRWVCRILCLVLLFGLSLSVLPLPASAVGAKVPVLCAAVSGGKAQDVAAGIPMLMNDQFYVLTRSNFYDSSNQGYIMFLEDSDQGYDLTYDGLWGDYVVFAAELPSSASSSFFDHNGTPVVGESYTLLGLDYNNWELTQRSATITDAGNKDSGYFYEVGVDADVEGIAALAVIVDENDGIIAICGLNGSFAMGGSSGGGDTPSDGGSSGGSSGDGSSDDGSSGGSSSDSGSSGTAGRDSGKSEKIPVTTIAICVGGVVLVALVLFLLLKKKTPTSQPNYDVIVPVNPGPIPQNNNGPYVAPTEPVSPPPVPGNVRLSLNVISGPMAGQCYSISDGATLVGRALEANIRYPADTKGVSRKHCQIFWKNGALQIMDLGSTSGTFLRGKGQLQANVPVALTAGDIIYLGSKQVALQLKSGS